MSQMKKVIESRKFHNQLKQLHGILNRIGFEYCLVDGKDSITIKITRKK